MEARGARTWIFVGFVLGFAAIIAAVWVMIADFSDSSEYQRALYIFMSEYLNLIVIIIFSSGRSKGYKEQLASCESFAAKCIHFLCIACIQVWSLRRIMEHVNL